MLYFIYFLRANSSDVVNYDYLKAQDKILLWWLTSWLMALFIVMVWKLVDYFRPK